jgi:UDP-N-acetylglucosamine--N-acetylmuramyl-(pentapeptide) pyrophosphoryl-undecaprenol N-acetylglucosamine transferase
VVVFGGSQGALHVDRALVESVDRLRTDGVQILLLAGKAHARTMRSRLEGSRVPVRVVDFLERMELAYAVADLVVARAGATSVAEVAVCGVASVLVPYPYATGNHQEANARALERAGGAEVLLDDELDGGVLAGRIDALLADETRRREMGERARAWSRPDADEALARVVTSAGAAG